MVPIGVGLVGLSGAPPDKYEGVSWVPKAHLPFLLDSPNFKIVALLNTSIASGKAAVERYNLSSNIELYEDPEDLAKDPKVDLVVVSTRVDRHFACARPSIVAGKSVFVEWPLERNLEIAREMTALAAKHGSKTMVGIQGSFSLPVRKLKEIIESGKIGKVISSTILAPLGNGGHTESKNVRYFLDRDVGGNILSIHFGHSLEFITSVLGEFKSFDSLLKISYKHKDVVDLANNNAVVVKDAPNTVPDQIMLHGITTSDAPISMHLRGGSPKIGMHGMDWRIQGEKGELRLTDSWWSLNTGSSDTEIQWYDVERGTVERLEPDEDEWGHLPTSAQGIARQYEAFRKGDWYPDFGWAVKRHEMIEEMWKRFDKS